MTVQTGANMSSMRLEAPQPRVTALGRKRRVRVMMKRVMMMMMMMMMMMVRMMMDADGG